MKALGSDISNSPGRDLVRIPQTPYIIMCTYDAVDPHPTVGMTSNITSQRTYNQSNVNEYDKELISQPASQPQPLGEFIEAIFPTSTPPTARRTHQRHINHVCFCTLFILILCRRIALICQLQHTSLAPP